MKLNISLKHTWEGEKYRSCEIQSCLYCNSAAERRSGRLQMKHTLIVFTSLGPVCLEYTWEDPVMAIHSGKLLFEEIIFFKKA